MKTLKQPIVFAAALIMAVAMALTAGCEQKSAEASEETAINKLPSKEEMIKRGEYLVLVGGCHDCHSPKVMTEHGPEPDMSRALSGHPKDAELPEVDLSNVGKWVLFSMDLTAAVGPWGVSFAANLTPDERTGLGGWDEEIFIKALRTGKHAGIEDGRPILPPMPWFNFGKMEQEDLQALFAYLQSLPAVNNKVPDPIFMDQIATSDKVKLASKKI